MWVCRNWPLKAWQGSVVAGLTILAIVVPIIWMGTQHADAQTPPLEPRNLESPWGAPIKAGMLSKLPRDQKIAVMYVAGDDESAHLATQIFAFLKANGFKMKEDGISQGVFSPPLHGLAFATDTNTFEVGSK